MHRFFIPPEKIVGQTIILDDPRELHHLRDVRRLGKGDEVVCFDGQGREYAGAIIASRAGQVVIQIARTREPVKRGVDIWLAQSLLKGERFEWVAQKATELGVARLTPLLTRHTVVKVGAAQGPRKQARWQRIATESAKQCGRATVPQIDPPCRFDEAIPQLAACGLVVMPTLAVTTMPLREVLEEGCGRRTACIGVLIGPEGDFSREEVALAEAHGARPVSLGEFTLRSETAAIAKVAILQYELRVSSDELTRKERWQK